MAGFKDITLHGMLWLVGVDVQSPDEAWNCDTSFKTVFAKGHPTWMEYTVYNIQPC